ncbi:MAG: ABC transporter permease [Rectinemataceae bacterium]|jgi:ribose transport system permease protein
MDNGIPQQPAQGAKVEQTSNGKGLKIALDKLVIFGAFVALFILFSLTARNFFTMRNVLTLALQTSTITLMGIGVTFTIITGGIDLSIGSVVALTGTIAVMAANVGIPIWLSMTLGLLTGILCGFTSGLLITGLKLPPFIATLGMMMVVRGVVLTITNAMSKPAPEAFGNLGNNTLFKLSQQFPGIAYPVFIMIIAAIVFGFFLRKTRVGRYTYAIGSNEEASRLSGIKVARIKLIAYMISGFCAALTGIILASRMVTSQPNGGMSYELNAIASSVIGGTSLMGGIGTVAGAVVGSFIIGVLGVGLTMQGASYFVQQIAIGLVVIGSVAVDQLRYKKK